MNAKNAIAGILASLLTVSPAFAWDGAAYLASLSLPQIFLWVLTFAVVYAISIGFLGKKVGTVLGLVAGFFVLMTVPGAVIGVIAGMSSGLIALVIGIIALIALVTMTGATGIKTGVQDGKRVAREVKWVEAHSTALAAGVIAIVVIMFVAAGGLPLIGIPGIPAIGYGTWLLVFVGLAVLWMLSGEE